MGQRPYQIYFHSFFKKRIYSFESSVTERENESVTSSGSLPRGYNNQDWLTVKPGAELHSNLPHG